MVQASCLCSSPAFLKKCFLISLALPDSCFRLLGNQQPRTIHGPRVRQPAAHRAPRHKHRHRQRGRGGNRSEKVVIESRRWHSCAASVYSAGDRIKLAELARTRKEIPERASPPLIPTARHLTTNIITTRTSKSFPGPTCVPTLSKWCGTGRSRCTRWTFTRTARSPQREGTERFDSGR